jgi:lysyl endopeptidase
MKKICFVLILLSVIGIVYGQVETRYFPDSTKLSKIKSVSNLTKTKKIKTFPLFDARRLVEEDSLDRINMADIPFRFGKGFDTNITFEDGIWQNVTNGRVWSMEFKSAGAKSINFVFNDLYLPDSVELYITNADQSVLYGPVTSVQNTKDGFFLTDLIEGDDVTIYLFEPKNQIGQSRLTIKKVVHAYRSIFDNVAGELSSTGILPCHNDVACYGDYEKEAKAVAVVLLSSGDATCSGSLVMTADNSFRPYFLTAFHCIDADSPGYLTSSEIAESERWMFKFNYKKTDCNGSYVAPGITYNGAAFRAANVTSDFALMEMTTNPANVSNSNAVWLGWDKSGNIPLSGTYIHHPQGTPMKISFDPTGLILNNNNINWDNGVNSPANTHWLTSLNNGTAEAGSSGSPLLNENKRVIGQLHGGGDGCPTVAKVSGAFHLSWTGGGTNETRLSNWLDPRGSGAQTTNSSYYPSISGSDYVCASNSSMDAQSYTINNKPASSTVTWQCTSNLRIASSSASSCSVYGTSAGYGTITASVNTNSTIVTITKMVEIASITGSPYLSYSNSGNYTRLEVSTPNIYGIIGYIWNIRSLPNGSTQTYNTGPNGYYLSVPYGSYYVECRIVTKCGQLLTNLYVNGAGYTMSTYPNPVDQTLYVEINGVENLSKADISSQKARSYDIRLYNIQGVLLKNAKSNGERISLDVSSLVDGNYFLHIYESGLNEPQIQKIIVQHSLISR